MLTATQSERELRAQIAQARSFIGLFPDPAFRRELWTEFFDGLREGMARERAGQSQSNVVPLRRVS